MSESKKRNVTIWLEPEWVARIDSLAEKAEVSRTRLLENLVKMNVEELEMMDKVGLYRMSILIRDMKEALKAWRVGIEDDPERQASLKQGCVTPA